MIDTRKRLLTEALGEEWVEPYKIWEGPFYVTKDRNRTFTTADDYEALRVAVIVPNVERFVGYLCDRNDRYLFTPFSTFVWWLTLSPEECTEIICNFGIEMLGWEVKE